MACVWCLALSKSLFLRLRFEDRRAGTENKGNCFETNENSYWSSLETTQKHITKIIQPYRERMIEKHKLKPDAKLILLLDYWPVHTGTELRTWIRSEFVWLILIYVPASCTPVWQPCHVGLQRVSSTMLENKLRNALLVRWALFLRFKYCLC